MYGDDRFADLGHPAHVGHLRWVLNHQDFTVVLHDLVDHAWRGGDQVLVELTLQPLLHDLHVQQAQEAAAETKTQRLADFGFVVQRGIVEFEFFECVAQRVVFAGFSRVQAGKNLGLDFLKTWQRLSRRAQVVGQLFFECDGVAHLRRLQFLDACNDVAHFTGFERSAGLVRGGENAQIVCVIHSVGRHHLEAFTLAQAAVHHTHQHHHTDIRIEPAVDDHRAQRRVGVALGRRHMRNHGFKDVVDADTRLGRARNGISGVDADHVFDLGTCVVQVGVGQVNLVEHRQHFHTQVERGVAVGHCLRFNTL